MAVTCRPSRPAALLCRQRSRCRATSAVTGTVAPRGILRRSGYVRRPGTRRTAERIGWPGVRPGPQHSAGFVELTYRTSAPRTSRSLTGELAGHAVCRLERLAELRQQPLGDAELAPVRVAHQVACHAIE